MTHENMDQALIERVNGLGALYENLSLDNLPELAKFYAVHALSLIHI